MTIQSIANCDEIHPKVASLKFDQLIWKLTESSEAKLTKEDCSLAEREYRRFLSLKLFYPKEELVPNKLLDEFWHSHILDTESYRRDCDSVFGHFLDHFPYFGIYGEEDESKLEETFQKTVSLYERHFGKYPMNQLHAARCEGHDCHVTSSCACRSPGTCK